MTAIPIDEIAMLHPVAHMAELLKSAGRVTHGNGSAAGREVIPSFLDFNNGSIVPRVLRAKIW